MHRALQLVTLLLFSHLHGQDLDLDRLFEDRNLGPVHDLLNKGDYDLVSRICGSAVQRGMKAPEWRILRVRSLMLLGQDTDARDEVQLAVKTFPDHLELLMLQYENAKSLGRGDIADSALKGVNSAAKSKSAKERSAGEWVALGQAALALGADAQKVIQQYFQIAKKKDSKLELAYLAEGHLALQKNDAKRAADVFREGIKAHGETANLRVGLALTYANGDREKQQENLLRALELNPVHSGALLSQAELLIGAEKFLEAEAAIQKVLVVCESNPEAWALRAAVAKLSATDMSKVTSARASGLQRWDKNPQIDHTIGRVLSGAYRFAEGSLHQRQALTFDADFLPAKIQLCHDLLRLGEEDEAWKLAANIREKDGYNVRAHNLGQLERKMETYTTKSFEDFILKMPKSDWPIYGERALALLREAKSVLSAKYALDLKRPVIVEFFGEQQDFAIRTFGSLGGQGLLGVCFGTVITMNRPGGLAHARNNWEATLWHEFCHVITLTLTQNKMPRWLSEGISVHEEGQRHPLWGMSMNNDFRNMILEEGAVTPVGQLSSAFLNPKSQEHLLFAYFQSSQVVAYLLEQFGPEKFQSILRDLAAGKQINQALEANTVSLGNLEKDFARYLQAKAEAYGSEADWKKPEADAVNPLDTESLAAFQKKQPNNLWAIQLQVAALIEAERWEAILPITDRLIKLVPQDVSPEGGYQMQAMALRKLNRTKEETPLLRHIAKINSSAMSIFLRLIELDLKNQDWPQVQTNAQNAIALNPFLRIPQQASAESAEALGEKAEAISAYQRVLVIETGSAAMTHFKLAHLLRETDAVLAKRHLLDSLALAPRYREGLALLRDWK